MAGEKGDKMFKNRIFKDTKIFKWKSTIAVFWRISTLILLVPIMLSNIFIIGYFISASNNQIKAYHTDTLYSKEKSVDAALADILSKSYVLANREIVRKFITISDYDSVSNYQKSQISMAINSEIMQVIGGNKYVSSIYVYNSDSDYVIGSNYSGCLGNMFDNSWDNECTKNPQQTNVFCRSFNNRQYLSVCYPINSTVGTRSGIVVVNADALMLLDLNNTYIDDSIYYLVDDTGMVLLSEKSDDIGKKIFEITDVIGKETLGQEVFAETRGNRLVSVHKSNENIGFHIVISENNFNNTMKSVWINIILSIIGCVLVWIGASFLISMNIYRSMNNILDVFSDPDNGIMYDDGKDELNYIYENLCTVADADKDTEKKNLNKFLVLKNTRLVALQNQITPHFLFNTLQCINMSAMKIFKGNNEVSKMIILLSELVKNALDTDEIVISLAEEIKFAKKYIELQSIKYHDSFSVIWDIDKEIQDYSVVKMCIQPLLENSIAYGVSRFNEGGEIIVTAKIKEDKLYVYVMDNGIQIDKTTVNALKESLDKKEEISSKNIGLKNVNWRIKLLFGDEYGCNIESCELGTCVSICFPLEKI